jgi:hypothetical protein
VRLTCVGSLASIRSGRQSDNAGLPVEVRQGRWMHARIHGESHKGADHDKENGQPRGSCHVGKHSLDGEL